MEPLFFLVAILVAIILSTVTYTYLQHGTKGLSRLFGLYETDIFRSTRRRSFRDMAAKINLNGTTFTSVKSVRIDQSGVFVNGDLVGNSAELIKLPKLDLQIIEGSLEKVDCNVLDVKGDINGRVDANTVDVTGNVIGDIKTNTADIGGNVTGDVNGNMVTCGKVSGKVSATMVTTR